MQLFPGPKSRIRQEPSVLVKKWIFDDLFHKKGLLFVILVPGKNPTIRISSFFGEMWLWRSLRLLRLSNVIEAEEVLRPGISQLGTSESSRFLNSALF